ncbi:MAG: hypothetical protein JSR82_18970 [Verrucomicrobia bacterium]|nr:hypothetical protein [Verrucomicrobiota bacterium]
MQKFSRLLSRTALLVGSAGLLFALTQQRELYPVKIAGGGQATVWASSAWARGSDTPPQTLHLLHANKAVSVQMTFLARTAQAPDSREALDRALLEMAQPLVAGSVEKKVAPKVLETNGGIAGYVSLTDARLVGVAKPPAGEFRYLHSGLRVTEKYVLIFTVLSNVQSGDDLLTAFQIVGTNVDLK